MLSSLLDGSVDGEAQLLLRKLGKRDTVTKLKGLSELRDALTSHDADWVASFMPHWVPCFCRLSADASWQVREASSAVLGHMTGVLGRQLAPHLKPLMAAWLCARHDPHAATSAAAAAALSAAFSSPKKLGDALLFCREELVRGLEERALTPLPPRSKDPNENGEAVETHARRVGSALRAASQLLSFTKVEQQPAADSAGASSGRAAAAAQPSAAREESVNQTVNLLGAALCAPDVWKLCASKSTFVRLSAYGWAESVLRHSPTQLAPAHASDLATLLLGGLADEDAACQAALWDPLLLLLRSHATTVSKSPAARHTLPRLAALLRHGCQGAAPTVSRALLPLAALLPPELFVPDTGRGRVGTPDTGGGGDGLPRAALLLSAIWEGLGSPGLPSSHAKAMLKAYGELLLLFLVRVSEWGGEASDGLSGAAAAAAAAAAAHLLRRAMGAPITALLEGTLPARLSEAEAVDGLAAAAEALAASARCGAAVAPFWREIAASCGEACTGGGPVGRPVGEVVGSAGVFLAAVVGRLERRGESAAAGTQLLHLRSAVGAMCTDHLYPAARYGAPGASALLLALTRPYGLCALWHYAAPNPGLSPGPTSSPSPGPVLTPSPSPRPSPSPSPSPSTPGSWLLELLPTCNGTRVRVATSAIPAGAPPEAGVASALVEDVLLPWAREAAANGESDGTLDREARADLNRKISPAHNQEMDTTGVAAELGQAANGGGVGAGAGLSGLVGGSAAAVSARTVASLWARLLQEEAGWDEAGRAAVGSASVGDDVAGGVATLTDPPVRIHWRRLLRLLAGGGNTAGGSAPQPDWHWVAQLLAAVTGDDGAMGGGRHSHLRSHLPCAELDALAVRAAAAALGCGAGTSMDASTDASRAVYMDASTDASARAAQRVVLMCCEGRGAAGAGGTSSGSVGVLSDVAAARVLALCGSALLALVARASASPEIDIRQGPETPDRRALESWCARAETALRICSPLLRPPPPEPSEGGGPPPPGNQNSQRDSTIDAHARAAAQCLGAAFESLGLERTIDRVNAASAAQMVDGHALVADAHAAHPAGSDAVARPGIVGSGWSGGVAEHAAETHPEQSEGWDGLLCVEASVPEAEPVLEALAADPFQAEAQAEVEMETETEELGGGETVLGAGAEEAVALPTDGAAVHGAFDTAHSAPPTARVAAAAARLWVAESAPVDAWLRSCSPPVHAEFRASLWRAAMAAAPISLAAHSGWRGRARRWAWMVRRLLQLREGSEVYHGGGTGEARASGGGGEGTGGVGGGPASAPPPLESLLGDAAWGDMADTGGGADMEDTGGGPDRRWLLAVLAFELLVERSIDGAATPHLLLGSSPLCHALPLLPLHLLRLFFARCNSKQDASAAATHLETAGWSGAAVADVRAFVLCVLIPHLRMGASGPVGADGRSPEDGGLATITEDSATPTLSGHAAATPEDFRAGRGYSADLAAAAMAMAVSGDAHARSALFLLIPRAMPSQSDPLLLSSRFCTNGAGAVALACDLDAMASDVAGIPTAGQAAVPSLHARLAARLAAFHTRLHALDLVIQYSHASRPALILPSTRLSSPLADVEHTPSPPEPLELPVTAVAALLALRPGAAAAARAAEARLGTGGGARDGISKEDLLTYARLRMVGVLLPAADLSMIPVGGLLEQLRRLALAADATGPASSGLSGRGGADAGGGPAALRVALCACVGAAVSTLGASPSTRPLLLSHSRWMAALVETALRSAAAALAPHGDVSAAHAEWVAFGGWATVLQASAELVLCLGRVPTVDGPNDPPAAAAAAASLLRTAGGTSSVGEVDMEALTEAVQAAASRRGRLQQASLLLLLAAAPRFGRARWAQRAWLDGLGSVRAGPPSLLPAAAALVPLTRLVAAPHPLVRLLALECLERVPSSAGGGEAGGEAGGASSSEESEHADEPMPLRFAFGGGAVSGTAGAFARGTGTEAHGEPVASLALLQGWMSGGADGTGSDGAGADAGQGSETEVRLLAWGCALALLPHMPSTVRSRVEIGLKAGPLPHFMTHCLLPALPLDRPPLAPLRPASTAPTPDHPASDPTTSVTGTLLAPLSAMRQTRRQATPDRGTSPPTTPTPDVHALAASIFAVMLRRVPALCRHWWSSDLTSRSATAAVAKYTEVHVSPWLLRREAEAVSASASSGGDDFSVKASAASRTITATYSYEGTYMQIVLQLDKCHPLRTVEVECTQRAGVSDARWRKWQRTISTMLRTQNGSIGDALTLFKDNVDQVFEGVEECPICYQIVHGTTRQLPRLACRTCSNKFHAACLYRWFSSSQKSTCPLCQTTF